MRSWIWDALGTARHVLENFQRCCHPNPIPNPTLPYLNRKRQGSHTGSCPHRSLLVSCWQVDGSWFLLGPASILAWHPGLFSLAANLSASIGPCEAQYLGLLALFTSLSHP